MPYYRKLKGFTQEELAENADMRTSTMRKLENPNLYVGITLEKICRIANALVVTESRLDFYKMTQG